MDGDVYRPPAARLHRSTSPLAGSGEANAASKQAEPGALRRLRGASSARSTVASMRSPSTRLSVSVTGTTGMAAPCRRCGRDDGRDEFGAARAAAPRRGRGRRGRRPDPGPRASSAANPARPSPAAAPRPSTTAPRRPREPGAVLELATPSGDDDDDRATSGAAARPRSVHASNGRPPIRPGACRRRPSAPRPGRHDDRVGAARRAIGTRSIEPRLGEDHPPGDGLEHPGDGHVEVLVDVPGAALDDDHRAVIEEADALARPPCPPG